MEVALIVEGREHLNDRTIRWHIMTGEYPPQPGGVSDYTRQVARGLADAGDQVTVWAPETKGTTPESPGVTVRRLPGHFGPKALWQLSRALGKESRPFRLLIQYVPHMYGLKGMNLLFTVWVNLRARRFAPVWVMFHEVMYPIEPGQPLRHAILGRVTRMMASMVARAADRLFVSIPAWRDFLWRICPIARKAEWLPVPSNLPANPPPERVTAARLQHAGPPGTQIIGHFGTFGYLITHILEPTTDILLTRNPSTRLLLLGRGSVQFRDRLIHNRPEWANRVLATGELPADELAAHLAACDILLQPYPDGVSSRRGSVMAGLSIGVPIVSNLGFLSESVWAADKKVALAVAPDPSVLASVAEELLNQPVAMRSARGKNASRWYRDRFALERTIVTLRNEAKLA